MRKQRVTQQGIVFGIFVLLFVGFSLFLPGFLTADNMIALLQNVAVLGILSLGMAIVIIGRGIDLSMIATLAVPPGLILQMVQNGHSVTESFAAQMSMWRTVKKFGVEEVIDPRETRAVLARLVRVATRAIDPGPIHGPQVRP